MSISPVESRPVAPAAVGSPAPSSRTSPSSRAPHAADVDTPSPFARLLPGLGAEAKAGEATIHRAVAASAAGKDRGPSELLALQAGVYRYSEVIDLAAKLVDRASNGVKTVLSGQ